MRALFTPRWVAVHAAVLVLVAAFLALGWWQMGRAADGNMLSFGYAIQWPAFAAFVVWVWISEMRKAARSSAVPVDLGLRTVVEDQSTVPSPRSTGVTGVGGRRSRNEAAYDDSDDPQLAAYNHYLAWCSAHPYATPADYPGPPQSKELPS